ncbi:MAG: ABC transporter [Epulopiscium sp. Nele67-Bin002]|nr:MAG: ABC transporter [Epulopiscium sp. Nuni2H_MBin001]OON91986.1 MAG: ABC transporter [Epulopiscium sp. Nele67-Bin002]OON92599.1 MAG: ABC transporter [Epulopiscium sp. Nele67-Bin001]
MFELLKYYLSFSFVQYALIVGVLVSLCSGLLGVILVLKRFAYIGDGLSHVAFGVMSVAMCLNMVDNMLLTIPVTIIVAILLIKDGSNRKLTGDTALAMLSVGSMAFGYLIINVFATSSNIAGDVCSALFGATSILTLSSQDVKISVAMSLIVICIFIIYYNKIFTVTFDETFAKATGIKTDKYNLLIAVITAIVIVIAMNLVGALLVSALIIFPAVSAMTLFHQFNYVVILSGCLSIFNSAAGIIISILFSTPVGATIVMTSVATFFILKILSLLIKR